MKNLKKVLAVTLSAAMVMGTAMPVMAADTTVDNGNGSSDVTAPIYSLDVVKVVVPSAYEVAFNPGELTVKTDASTGTSTDQILSRNFGIINQSSKAKIVTVGLKVEDQNTDSPIEFVGSSDEVDNAEMDDFAIYLQAVPADSTEVKVGTAPSAAAADKTTTAAALKDVVMTKATAGIVPLSAGDNELQFVLGKATYTPLSGSEVTLGTSIGNNVASNYELTGLAAGGKGITAFTLTGSMNETAEWHTLNAGIKITPTYTMKTVTDDAVTSMVKSGTGAVYENPNPEFKTGSAVGTIQYTVGTGTTAVKTIKSITIPFKDGKLYDGYNALPRTWEAATDENGLITFNTAYVGSYVSAFPDDTEKEATITYITQDDEEKTAKVNVKIK